MNDTVETQATDSSELHLKVKTLQPATYEITTPKEVCSLITYTDE